MSFKKIGSLLGILFPILSICFIILLALFIPGYSHVEKYVSDIGRYGSDLQGIYSVLMISMGCVLIVFSLALYSDIKKNKYSLVAPVLLILFSLSFIGLVAFPCEGECSLIPPGSIHSLFVSLCFISLVFVPIFFWLSTKCDKRWKSYKTFNMIMQVLGIISLILFAIKIEPIVGLLQRAFLLVYFIWVGVISLKLFKLSNPG